MADDSKRRDDAPDEGQKLRPMERGPEISGDEATDHYGDPLSNRREERDQRRGGAEPGNESFDTGKNRGE